MNTICSVFVLLFLTLVSFIRTEHISNKTSISANPEKTKNPSNELVKSRIKYTQWEDYKECRVQEICLDDAEHCESNVTLRDLEKEEELVIIDLPKGLEEEHVINHGDVSRKISQICDVAFVTNRSKSNCMVLRTPNEVPCQEETGITVLRSKLWT